ncbi:MAG: lipase maturation factor family protein [Candidatus Nanohaloarchaea archaeon]|nr:lipase maturation factor family protein [Candidatus Nanohaloarchaea archaeon]
MTEASRDNGIRGKIWRAGKRLVEPVGDFQTARWLFLRLVAVIAFIAFLSFHLQMSGLVGEKGILPAQDFLDRIEENTGTERYLEFPTLAWLGSSNTALHTITTAGMLVSIVLFFNLAPTVALFLLWVLYLSIVTVGQVFMSYQWDLLLLETLFLSIFIAPLHVSRANPQKENPPSRLSMLIMWFLLFKLLFMSGMSKLISGDPAWTNLTALNYHYLTQPLPTPLAWFMDKLPSLFHQVSASIMFVAEIIVPFLFFTPRKIRIKAAYISIGLQVAIMVTGNYTFFNLLTIALSLLLLDDQHLSWIRGKLGRWIPEAGKDVPRTWKGIAVVLAGFLVVINLVLFAQMFGISVPGSVSELKNGVSQFRTVNSYGLFAVMTKKRPEIMVEGSVDGENWRRYRFKYKPGSTREAPAVVAPHQPRLDWQMWFAAYSSPRRSRWFVSFVRKLLQGSEPVEKLMAEVPFEEGPRYIRAVRYHYRFSNHTELWKRGKWWRRERKDLYLPPVHLGSR